jgi:Uma2 family endonuclease
LNDCHEEQMSMSMSRDITAAPSLPGLIAKAFHDDNALIELSQVFAPATIERFGGQLIVSPGAGGKTGRRNSRLTRILDEYAETYGYVSFDSSTGFHMPDDDTPGPDGALITKERWNQLTEAEKEGLPPLVPDVVVELRSKSQIAPKVGMDVLN